MYRGNGCSDCYIFQFYHNFCFPEMPANPPLVEVAPLHPAQALVPQSLLILLPRPHHSQLLQDLVNRNQHRRRKRRRRKALNGSRPFSNHGLKINRRTFDEEIFALKSGRTMCHWKTVTQLVTTI